MWKQLFFLHRLYGVDEKVAQKKGGCLWFYVTAYLFTCLPIYLPIFADSTSLRIHN